MRAAYLYQTINLMVGILMVPLLLRYLDVNGFILWSIFTTFGGITLQIESAIQTVSVREISKQFHSGNSAALHVAVRKAKKAYFILTVSVLFPVLGIGILYLNFIAKEKLGIDGSAEWIIFMLAYALNYYFGANNSILLGLVHVARYNNINSLSRTINFISTYAFLNLGYSVLGLSLSFSISVVIGVMLIARAAKEVINNYKSTPENNCNPPVQFENGKSLHIVKYTFYMLSSFILYKGGVLVAAAYFPNDTVGSYSLTIQAFTMLTMLALVPLQVWLHKLVGAIASGEFQKIFHELAISIVSVNLIYIIGAFSLFIIGNQLLVFINSKIMLVDNLNYLLIFLAFLVELNILLLVNYLVIKSNYEFVKFYVTFSLVGITLAILLIWLANSSISILLIVPLCIQAFLCLPNVFRRTCRELGVAPSEFINGLGRLKWVR